MIDLVSLIFILLAWFVEMPLWLSIVLTVLCSIRAIVILIVGIRGIIVDGELNLFNF